MPPRVRALFRRVIAERTRLGIVAAGHAANQLQVLVFDFLAYPLVIAWLGPIPGGAIMTASSALFSWVVIILYRRSDRDWLGLEALRDLRDGAPPKSWMLRSTRSVLRRGQLVALVVLSIRFDPFVAVLYLRDGSAGERGLSARECRLFWASVLISNLYWIGVVSIAVEVLRAIVAIW